MINPTYRILPLPPMKFQVISIPKSKTNYSFFHLLPITPKTNMAGNGKWTMNVAIIVFWGGYSLPNYLFCLFRLRIPTVFCHQNPPNRGPPRVQQSHYPPNASKQKPGFSGGVVSIHLTGCWLVSTQLEKCDRQIGSISPGFGRVLLFNLLALRLLSPQKWLIWGPKHPCYTGLNPSIGGSKDS